MHNVNFKSDIAADNTIETPLELCKFITALVLAVMTPKKILDPSAGKGNLTRYFPGAEVLSYEIKQGRDFFECTKEDCDDVDIVICNPPFNNSNSRGRGRKLLPELFLKHILEVAPENTPIVLITPIGLRVNVRKASKRLEFLSKLEISSIVTLPLDLFHEVLIHSEILIFNMPKIGKSHYAYHEDTVIRKLPTNILSLCDTQKKCVTLDKTFLEVTKTVANCLGLQKKSGHLLCALAKSVDTNGCVTINSTTRNELAIILETNEQVITNNIKLLSESNLLVKKSRGYYLYNLMSVDDCQKITNREYESLNVDIKYYKDDCSPVISVLVE